MKKISCILITLMLLVASFTGCTKNDGLSNGLSIKICGYSDSIPENPHKLEYQDWSQDSFVDSTTSENIELKIGNVEVVGNYVETEKRFSEFYDTHKYRDEQNRYFSLTDDGKLSTYFFGNDPSHEEKKYAYTESECIEISNNFISNITDVSDYTVSSVFDEDRKMYTISYIKYADGFKCSDRAEIMIEETGYIYSFSSTMFGRISSDATTNFDCGIIQDQIISKLDNEYSSAKKSYDEVSYENFDYELTIDNDGEYALICSVDVKCTRSYDGYDTVVSERIQLLIQ